MSGLEQECKARPALLLFFAYYSDGFLHVPMKYPCQVGKEKRPLFHCPTACSLISRSLPSSRWVRGPCAYAALHRSAQRRSLHGANRLTTGSFCATRYALCSIHDSKNLLALEDFFLQQRLCQAVQGLAALGQDASRLLMGLCYQPLDLGIQALGRCLRVHTLVLFKRLLIEVGTSIRQVIDHQARLLAHAPP